MQRCFQLAQLGLGNVAPNPLVGSIVVHNNKIIGEGYHQQYGSAHAEVNAISSVKDKTLLKDATLYVNLEPCSHYGKTPPCADLIVSENIKQVVICNTDPNPLVAGKGIEKLKAVGIEVINGVLENEGWELNKRFFTFHTKKRPYIILKWAQSNDGYFTKKNNEQHWITGESAKKIVHRWRSEEQAILVGTQTVLTDNPELNNRYYTLEKQPTRVVIDKELKIPKHYKVYNNQIETLIFNKEIATIEEKTTLVKIPFENTLEEILAELYSRNLQSVIIEGGVTTLNNFILQNIWDEARILTGIINFTEGIKAPTVNGTTIEKNNIGEDQLTIIKNQ
jgi:diaminohydroxyphosphoribosylaminopyrimidine deaminase/5-amino-6-(5-phosphoribosylamino)uracil reductase